MIRKALEAFADIEDIFGSLREMESIYEKASFGNAARLGIINTATCQHTELQQYLAFRGP